MIRLNRKIKSLSLIEIIVATAVLSIGLIAVSQGLLMNLEGSNYAIDYLNVLSWMDWKFWEAQDKLTHYRTLLTDDMSGMFILGKRQFKWDLSYNLIEGTERSSLYELILRVFWKEGIKEARTIRSGYVLHVVPEK